MKVKPSASRGRKLFIITLGMMLALTMMLSACSSNKSNNGNNASPTAGTSSPNETAAGQPSESEHAPATITWTCGDDPKSPFILGVIDGFQKMYPWITVNYVSHEYKDLEKIAALQSAGTPADVACVDNLIGAYDQKMIDDLTPYQNSALKDFHIKQSLIPYLQIDGKLMAVPYGKAPYYLYVNKDLLAKHGVDMPTNEWTWDDFRSISRQVTNVNDSEWGYNSDAWWMYKLASVKSIGDGHAQQLMELNEDFSKSLANTPEVFDDLQLFKDMVNKDKSIPKPADLEAKGIKNAFLEGKVAFTPDGIWNARNMKDVQFDWDILPLPKGSQGHANPTILATLTLLSASKNKEAALAFMSYFGTQELGKFNIDQGGTSWTEDAELDDYLTKTPLYAGKNAEGVKIGADNPIAIPGKNVGGLDEYINDVQNAYGPVLFDGADVASTYTPIAEKFNKSKQ